MWHRGATAVYRLEAKGKKALERPGREGLWALLHAAQAILAEGTASRCLSLGLGPSEEVRYDVADAVASVASQEHREDSKILLYV